MDMPKITVVRYDEREQEEFAGCVQPADCSWILLVRRDGTPMLFTDRASVTEHDRRQQS